MRHILGEKALQVTFFPSFHAVSPVYAPPVINPGEQVGGTFPPGSDHALLARRCICLLTVQSAKQFWILKPVRGCGQEETSKQGVVPCLFTA